MEIVRDSASFSSWSDRMVFATSRSISRFIAVAYMERHISAPFNGRMFEEMRSAIKVRTSSLSFRRRHCCSCFRMARRVSKDDCVICVVTPETKRDTRRASRPGISDGCLSEVRMICLPSP